MNEKARKKIEGYYDEKKDAFIVTYDRDGIVSAPAEEERSPEDEKDHKEKMKELFKKYKPAWMKLITYLRSITLDFRPSRKKFFIRKREQIRFCKCEIPIFSNMSNNCAECGGYENPL